jgi:hypothetical protein
MALTQRIARRVIGSWRIEGTESLDGHCYGLDIRGDARRAPSIVAQLVHWKPGRLGCDTCSSSLMRVELAEERSATDGDVVFTGRVPRNVRDSWVDARLALTIREQGGALELRGVLEAEGDTHDVRLSPSETEPLFDLLREP